MAEHTPTSWTAINGGVDIVDNATCGLIANVWARGENRAGPIAQANAAFIVKAVNSHGALTNVLTDARNAIASLPMETLGYASDPMGLPVSWPIRDELLHRIDEALRAAIPTRSEKEAADA